MATARRADLLSTHEVLAVHPRRATLALLAALTVLLGACAPLTGTQPPTVAADVDGASIGVATVEEQFEALAALPQFAAELEAQPGLADQVESVLLSLLIQRELYRTGAGELGFEVTEEEVDEFVAAEAGGETDPDALREALAAQGISLEFARLQTELQLYQEGVIDALVGDRELSDEELEEAYGELYGVTPRARHILLESEGEAEDVLDRLDDGEDFGDLAEEVSVDPAAETNRGELGPITEGQFDEDFTAAVHDADDGDVVGPVETQFGYHVIERMPPPPLEEVEEQVRDAAEAETIGDALDAWTRERVESASIDVNPRFGAWDDASGSVEPVSALDRPTPLAR